MTELQSGKTLGEVADATSGKSKAGLVAALVADEKSHLAQAVKDGRLTQSQADYDWPRTAKPGSPTL